MPAHIHVRVPEDVRLLCDLHDGDAPGQAVAQNFIHRHGHVVARLAGPQQIDMALLAQVPLPGPNVQDIPLHTGDAFDALIGIQAAQGLFGDIQDNSPALGVAVGQQFVPVFDFLPHETTSSIF